MSKEKGLSGGGGSREPTPLGNETHHNSHMTIKFVPTVEHFLLYPIFSNDYNGSPDTASMRTCKLY